MKKYSIIPLLTEHADEICEDIKLQYETGVSSCPLFSCTLVPEGNPPKDKATELCDFIREIGSSYFVACVDVGHAAMAGNEPESFLAGMDGRILMALHIQDGNYREDSHTLPYLGGFNWTAIMQTLKQIGYQGELTFEIVKYLKNVPTELLLDALRFAEKIGRHLISVFDDFVL